ncbi:alginate O-acetyltransferase AlgF [Deinococcus aerius]|nr:alginate O-acetyltransferase AlgF [Deinococcus aerius]
MPRQPLAAMLVMATLSTSAAQQEGLYDPAPPSNSAFVRVAGAPAATLGTRSVVADKGAVSTYVVIPQGDVSVRAGAASQKFRVEAGKFYTVVLHGGKLSLLPDAPADNRAKALLVVYNLSSLPSVDLKTADGKTTVIQGVKPGESGNRAVNGITVDLATFAGPRSLNVMKAVRLERGKAYAIVVTDGGTTLTASTTTR